MSHLISIVSHAGEAKQFLLSSFYKLIDIFRESSLPKFIVTKWQRTRTESSNSEFNTFFFFA